jgi:hypothetical protein
MRVFTLTILSLAFALAGCDSVPSLSERFDPVPPQTRIYKAERAAAFDAARHAMEQIDFKVTRSGEAQGIVDGLSRVETGNSFQGARQYAMDVRLSDASPGHTAVAVLLRQQDESTSFAGATDKPVREHGLYGTYFAAFEHELGQKGVPAPSE